MEHVMSQRAALTKVGRLISKPGARDTLLQKGGLPNSTWSNIP